MVVKMVRKSSFFKEEIFSLRQMHKKSLSFLLLLTINSFAIKLDYPLGDSYTRSFENDLRLLCDSNC